MWLLLGVIWAMCLFFLFAILLYAFGCPLNSRHLFFGLLFRVILLRGAVGLLLWFPYFRSFLSGPILPLGLLVLTLPWPVVVSCPILSVGCPGRFAPCRSLGVLGGVVLFLGLLVCALRLLPVSCVFGVPSCVPPSGAWFFVFSRPAASLRLGTFLCPAYLFFSLFFALLSLLAYLRQAFCLLAFFRWVQSSRLVGVRSALNQPLWHSCLSSHSPLSRCHIHSLLAATLALLVFLCVWHWTLLRPSSTPLFSTLRFLGGYYILTRSFSFGVCSPHISPLHLQMLHFLSFVANSRVKAML